jgi:hypothetical protein
VAPQQSAQKTVARAPTAAPSTPAKAGWSAGASSGGRAGGIDLRDFKPNANDREGLRKMLGAMYGPTKQYADILQRTNPALKNVKDENLVGLYLYSMEGAPGLTYREVNQALRNGTPKEQAKLLPLAKAVAGALADLAPFKGNVFRGAQLTAEQLARYTPGATVTEPSFTSTSVDSKVAKRFATEAKLPPGKTPVVFTFESKGGGRELPFSRFPGEKEVLFSPGSAFQVAKLEKKNGQVLIKLVEVPK